MASYILDDKARFPGTTNPSIDDYARACSKAVDEALEKWPVAQTTENATVSTGFLGDKKFRSTLWTQSFDVSTREEDNGTPSLEELLSNLQDIFSSDDLEKHAKEWDTTFAGARIVEKLSKNENGNVNDDTILVHWKFNASPLAGRDMLYLVHKLEEEKDDNNNNNKNGRVLRLTYAYASVSDGWVKENTGKEVDYSINNDGVKRVRSFNCYPSCDRITIYNTDEKSTKKITVDHLLTPELAGGIVPFMFNNVFKKALIQQNAHESEAMREYVLSLCKTSKK